MADLYDYWKKLARRYTFSIAEYIEFGTKNEETLELFEKYFREITKEKFFEQASYVLFEVSKKYTRDTVFKWKKLPDAKNTLIKRLAQGYSSRIKKHFYLVLHRNIQSKSKIEDSESILEVADKLSYRWAAGIIISNYIASLLISLLKKENIKFNSDDIDHLYTILKGKTKNTKLKTFLGRNYRRFENADRTRNRCAHIIEGDPTKSEVQGSIDLAKILVKKFK